MSVSVGSVLPLTVYEEYDRSINGTLDFPPRGSPAVGLEDLEAAADVERLSAEPSSGKKSAE